MTQHVDDVEQISAVTVARFPELGEVLQDEVPIAGQWRRGTGNLITSIDPATGEAFAALHGVTIEDVDTAATVGLEVARSNWADWLPHERARVLYRIGNLIEEHAETISILQTLDTGKTRGETYALAMSAANTFRYMASVLETMTGEITPSRGPYLTFATWEPMGVVGTITPWNSPISSDAQKIAPALAAGNAVIAKPPVWAPWVTIFLARLCERAGLPAGLLSVLPGPGRSVGEAIVTHPMVGKVSFTGGTSTGKHLGELAARKVMPVTLELGGKSPTIIFEDADVDQAIAGVLYGIFSSTGQSCIAGSRVFVHRSIHDEFLDRLVKATERLVVGPGSDPRTQVAPLVTHQHRDGVAQMVVDAIAAGATAITGGAIPGDPALADGAYYLPTILTGVTNDASICQEEIFGPVAVVLPFDDEDELTGLANDTLFGLACGIWTKDLVRAWRVAKKVQAGTVWINTYKQFSISTPFSGLKESGLGTEKGRSGILSYMNQKSIYVDVSGEPLAWARIKE
ncbi:aldehyde dehydrogenase family protein [Enemella sp. A6]|uniref:aldehyde dehydrogenase family protein n=1 Tax=Enemella sp. A6 TaxID=3440152 RepID=UPI003EB7F8F5